MLALLPSAQLPQCEDEAHKLTAGGAYVGEKLGISVATDGVLVIAGAYRDNDQALHAGSAFLFDATTGAELMQLLPTDGDTDDEFGISVGIDGGRAVVGAWQNTDFGIDTGSAYLFDTATGAQVAKLLASDASFFDKFGSSVAIDGNTVIVGAPGAHGPGTTSGAVYLFDATTGAEIAKLFPLDGEDGDRFGTSVDISVTIGSRSPSPSTSSRATVKLFGLNG